MIIFSIALCVYGISSLKTDNYDYFLDQVQRNLDQDVDPCDNFYRHACPITMKKEDIIVNYVSRKLSNIIQEQKEKSPLPYTIIEKLYAILNPNMTKPEDEFLQFLVALRETSYIIDYFRDNKIHLHEEHEKLHQITESILQITKEHMQMSAHKFGKNATQHIIDKIDEHQFIFGMESEVNAYKKFKNVLIQLDVIFKGHFKAQNKNPITERDVVLRKQEFYDILENIYSSVHSVLYNLNRYRMTIITNATDWNAVNMPMYTVLTFFEGVLFPLQNTRDATKYGYFGTIFGHELMHSYLRKYNLERDYALEKEGICILQHVHHVCETYAAEGLCRSGLLTFDEDAADYEGTKLAYKAFIQDFGSRLKDPVVNGMNVTNQQMFFYAFAKGFCRIDNDHRQQAGKYNEHSTSFVRVNGAFSLIKGFHEAFNCKAGDRMKDIANGHCTHFGNSVRRF